MKEGDKTVKRICKLFKDGEDLQQELVEEMSEHLGVGNWGTREELTSKGLFPNSQPWVNFLEALFSSGP